VDPEDVHLEHGSHVVQRRRGQGAEVGDARVVHDAPQAVAPRVDRCAQARHLCVVGHVADHRFDAVDPFEALGVRVAADGGEHGHPACSEMRGDREADAGTAAGDEHGLAHGRPYTGRSGGARRPRSWAEYRRAAAGGASGATMVA
jgi:hypothetical protein